MIEEEPLNGDLLEQLSINQLFEQQAGNFPNNTALIFQGQTLSYQQLNQGANQLARYLLRLGITKGTPVIICMDRGFEVIIAMLGIIKAGAAYVPVDPDYPLARIKQIIGDIDSSFLISVTGKQAVINSLDIKPTHIIYLDDNTHLVKQSKSNLQIECRGEDLAYIMYTSGSTGEPKGVMIPHRGVTRLVHKTNYIAVRPRHRFAFLSNIIFDASTFEIWGALLNGASLYIFASQILLNIEQLCREIISSKTSVMVLASAIFNLVFSMDPDVFSQLEYLLVGGEPLNKKNSLALLNNKHHPRYFLNGYGPTENTVFSATHLINKHDKDLPSIPIGHTVRYSQCYVLDKNYRLVADGEAGELYMGGYGLALGYWRRPDLNQQKFIINPFNSRTKLYKSGDLVRRLPNGELELIRRIDYQIKINSLLIEIGEIESVLLRHPAIEQAVVMCQQNQNSGFKQLIAYLLSPTPNNLSHSKLRQFLKAFLPASFIPHRFICCDSFPLSANGKIDRQALLQNHFSPLPIDSNYVPPRTATEQQLLPLWQRHLDKGKIGVLDNFFELGGDSLKLIKLLADVIDCWHIQLNVTGIRHGLCIADLADYIDKHIDERQLDKFIPISSGENQKDIFPLSLSQEQIFLHQLAMPKTPVYNETITVVVKESVSLIVMEQAINHILQRHQMLRARIKSVAGQVYNKIIPYQYYRLPFIDLSKNPRVGKKQAINIAEAQAKELFDLENASLYRFFLIKVSAREFYLFVTIHHIIADGMSLNLLLSELQTIYSNLDKKQTPRYNLPSLSGSYQDFVNWYRQQSRQADSQRHYHYWQRQLNDLPLFELKAIRRQVEAREIDLSLGSVEKFVIPTEVCQRLENIVKGGHYTPFTVLLSGFYVLLFRYSGQTDIPLASVLSLRYKTMFNDIFGDFLNTLILRVKLSAQMNGVELLDSVSTMLSRAQDHGIIPLQQLNDYLPQFCKTKFPCSVAFSLESTVESCQQPWQLDLYDVHTKTSKFDFCIALNHYQSSIIGKVEYRTRLFEPVMVRQLLQHYLQLLTIMADNLTKPISHWDFLSAAERQRLLHDWNNTKATYPDHKTLHQLFVEQAKRVPNIIAVSDGITTLNYQQLDEKSNMLAAYLCRQGLQHQQAVALYLQRRVHLIVAILAVLKAGGAYVPIDDKLPAARVVYMLNDTQARHVLCDNHAAYLPCLGEQNRQVINLDQLPTMTESVLTWSEQNGHPEDLAYIIYTSGSTGKPKGVLINHRGVVNMVTYQIKAFSLAAGMPISQFSAIGFDASVFEIFMALLSGGTLHIVPDVVCTEPQDFSLFLKQKAIAVAYIPPALLDYMPTDVQLPALNKIIIAGETGNQKTIEDWSEKYSIINCYGPAEATVWVSKYVYNTSQLGLVKCIGEPIQNIQAYVLDKRQRLVPIGVAGELYVGGVGLARGYLNKPHRTKAAFITNPFSDNPSEQLYKTGDYVRWLPDGNLEFIGRIDHQVKRHGQRLELGEIESQLTHHSAVKQAVVLVKQQERENTLFAFVSSDIQDQKQLSKTLCRYLQQYLPEYMIPSYFICRDQLALSVNHKIDRQVLQHWVDNNVLELVDLPKLRQKYVAPRSAWEKKLYQLWQDVLAIPHAFAMDDDFFQLGGNSIRVMKLIAVLYQNHNISIKADTIYQHSTIRDLAAIIETIAADNPVSEPVLDFQAEADQLIKRLTIRTGILSEKKEIKSLFFTGATGFIGAYLLKVFLTQTDMAIYCLVRADSQQTALQRLKSNLQKYKLWNNTYQSRIHIIVGHLDQDNFALSKFEYHHLATIIDIIFNCAGIVNFALPYAQLKNTNVMGLLNIINFAGSHNIPLHHCSTLAVTSFTHYYNHWPIIDEYYDVNFSEKCMAHEIGYTQSKWVGEKLIQAAQKQGLSAVIYRFGFVLCAESGYANLRDFWAIFLDVCQQIKAFPLLDDIKEEFVTVDYLAKALVSLATHPSIYEQPVYHIAPQRKNNINTNQFFEMVNKLGYKIIGLDYQQWLQKLRAFVAEHPDHLINGLMPLLSEKRLNEQTLLQLYQHSPAFSMANSSVLLADYDNITTSPTAITDTVITTYLDFLTKKYT
ncbi:MAG: amino acid adenylation domain-containing protein [Pseudomonadota bacterium]